jgi:aldehyde:ferredoxin oxidoreductase
MAEGKKVEGLDIMLDEYYEIRGWDKEGNPPA